MTLYLFFTAFVTKYATAGATVVFSIELREAGLAGEAVGSGLILHPSVMLDNQSN